MTLPTSGCRSSSFLQLFICILANKVLCNVTSHGLADVLSLAMMAHSGAVSRRHARSCRPGLVPRRPGRQLLFASVGRLWFNLLRLELLDGRGCVRPARGRTRVA